MHVTKQNFDEVIENIEMYLPTAAFVAIDEEMTGISMDEQSCYSMGDTPAKRYAKMREVASRYNIIQFGMALFHEKNVHLRCRLGAQIMRLMPSTSTSSPRQER